MSIVPGCRECSRLAGRVGFAEREFNDAARKSARRGSPVNDLEALRSYRSDARAVLAEHLAAHAGGAA